MGAGEGTRDAGKERARGKAAGEGVVGVVLKVQVGTAPFRRPGRGRKHD